MGASDQRRTRRFELRLPFELIRAGSRKVHDVGETQNLSSGGVLFTSAESVEIGDRIEYFITLPGSGQSDIRLHGVGRVVRRHPYRAAQNNSRPLTFAATLERYEFVRSRK